MMIRTEHRWVIAVALLALAACAGTGGDGPGNAPPPVRSAFTRSGEIKVGHFARTFDRKTGNETVVYHVLLSKTWVARQGQRVQDDLGRLILAATAPIEDLVMAALVDELDRRGFFALPRRAAFNREDIFVPGQRARALIVETEILPPTMVSLKDCALPPQQQAFLECFEVFKQLADSNPPAVMGVGIQPFRTFSDFPAGPVVEPAPTVQPGRARLVKPRTPPEERTDAEPSPGEKRPPVPPPPAQK